MGARHRPRAERLTAAAGLVALGSGAVGMAFEQAGPAVASATAEELAGWAARHHGALTAQSGVYLASTAPLLAFFAGLARSLRPEEGADRLVPAAGVLAGGTTWLAYQVSAQVEQLAMARQAARGAPATDVAAHAGRMRDLLRHGNAAFGVAAAATAVASLRHDVLPRWLGPVSAATAVAHVVPLAAGRSGSAAVEVLPYPFFVAWVASLTAALLRRERRR